LVTHSDGDGAWRSTLGKYAIRAYDAFSAEIMNTIAYHNRPMASTRSQRSVTA